MVRYFLEVAYKGTHYSGFQIQQNAATIQAEVEKAFHILHRKSVTLTGSSRTDAGVHAYQNYFHFDFDDELDFQFIYKMNAILPADIVIKNFYQKPLTAHSRFDALSRQYEYYLYKNKNPFLRETAFYYPYTLNIQLLQQAAALIKQQSNFYAFSKTNTQVTNYYCTISLSEWHIKEDTMVYCIIGNRFLKGMVRLLTATMLQVGRGKLTIAQLNDLFKDTTTKCHFSLPPTGLFLKKVTYSKDYFA